MRVAHTALISIFAALATATGAAGQPPSASQQADLDCLQIARTIAASQQGPWRTRQADRMEKFYLARLSSTDPSRDWLSMAMPMPNMPYGEFMGRRQRCEAELRRPATG